jgi:hypothetical protein
MVIGSRRALRHLGPDGGPYRFSRRFRFRQDNWTCRFVFHLSATFEALTGVSAFRPGVADGARSYRLELNDAHSRRYEG